MSLELQAECNSDCSLWYLFHLPWKTPKAIPYLYQMVTVLSIESIHDYFDFAFIICAIGYL